MGDTLVQTSGIRIVTIPLGFATFCAKLDVTVPKPSKVNVGLSSKKSDTSVSCVVVKSMMATLKKRPKSPCPRFVVMRTLSTGRPNASASSSLNEAESKFSSKGKNTWASTACKPDGIGVG